VKCRSTLKTGPIPFSFPMSIFASPVLIERTR
jgi:hypothetical protein